MRLLKITSFLTLFLIISCGESQPDVVDENAPLPEQIDQLIQANEYQTALSMLEEEDQTDPIIQRLLEKTHLNFGLYSMNTFDQTEMRTRMNRALTQFTEVLRINPENQVARTNINQILSIYKTIPERDPEPEVLEGLEEVGIEY
ncbi:MAG: hypothetical protein GVY07_16245 [Bacteroidetes bacterium]|jgi:hypothetical protein|nr:hypothetical protein [Bacteroidota bacterium]